MVKYVYKSVFFMGSKDQELVDKLLSDGYRPMSDIPTSIGILLFFEKAEGESDIFSLADYNGDESDVIVPPPKVKKTRKPRTKKVKVEEESEETTASIPETV